MPGNFFDQFDETAPAQAQGNYFDQFDVVNQGGPQSIGKRKKDMRTWGGRNVDPRKQAEADRLQALMGLPLGVGITAPMWPKQVQQKVHGGVAGAADGYTFGMMDEISGGLGSLIGRGEELKQRSRNALQLAQEDAPVSTFAGQLAGGIASPVNKLLLPAKGAQAAAGAAPAIASVVKAPTLTQAAKEGFIVGTKGGALYGAGSAEGGVSERAQGAAVGGVLGGVLGAPLGAGGQKLINAWNARSAPANVILETARQQIGVPNSSINALRKILSSSGYSGDDIDRGIVRIADRLQASTETGDRTGLFALELQKEFPTAQQNIQDVFQQLMTAPPSQGGSGRILTQALDNQYASQAPFIEGVAQQKLGTATVAEEQARLAAERAAIGETRDSVIKYAGTDARGRGIQNSMRQWWDELSNDPEVASAMRAAARQLGYGKTKEADEITQALASNPSALLQKFGEISGEAIRANRASPVLQQARKESETLFDELSKATRRQEKTPGAGAPQFERADPAMAQGPGPYKQQQSRFRENYSQEEAVADARGRFSQVRDPVKADEFVGWYNSLPDAEQSLVKTVVRQDIEKALRGGNIDADGAYTTGLKKTGVHDVLVRLFGKDGEDLSRAITQVVDEQKGLVGLDPRKGLQERVVRGPSADRARNLYTTNPIARLGDRLPAMSQMGDLALMSTGHLPYITMAKQGAKVFRPRARTREGLAQILAMRTLQGAPKATPKAPAPMASGAAAAAQGVQPAAPSPKLLPPMSAPTAPSKIAASAEGRMQAAQLQAQVAQQRLQASQQARAVEAEVRKLKLEAAQAEAAAQIAERLDKNFVKITEEEVRAIAKATLDQVKKVEQDLPKQAQRAADEQAARVRDTTILLRRQEAEEAVRAAREESVDTLRRVKEIEETTKNFAEAERIARQARELEKNATGWANSGYAMQLIKSGKSPNEIFEKTGIVTMSVSVNGKARSIVPPADAPGKTPFELLEQVLHFEKKFSPDRWPKWMTELKFRELKEHRPEVTYDEYITNIIPKWAKTFEEKQIRAKGAAIKKKREEDAKKAAERALDARIKEQIRQQRRGRIVMGVTGTAGVAGGAKYVDDRNKRIDRQYQAMESNPEVARLVQHALKSAGYYDGRVSANYEKSALALANFQRARGVPGADAGNLTPRTMKYLEESLIAAGKPDKARRLRDLRPDLIRPGHIAENTILGREAAEAARKRKAQQSTRK